jgi:protein-disulfide isomerase
MRQNYSAIQTRHNMLHPEFSVDYDHHRGCPFARIELVEYGDFQCEHCAEAYPVIKWLQISFGDLLRFVYRHYPILPRHPLAFEAAVATEAAGLQGKFWRMHDIIYENQKYLTRASFSEFAREIELDTKVFEDCGVRHILFQKVIADFESGVKSGVNFSPTFFINGVRYDGFDDFLSLHSALRNISHFETTER